MDRRFMTGEEISAALTAPGDRAANTELADRLRRAVEELPEPDRTVVRLHSEDCLDFGQIAKRLRLKDKDASRYIFKRALKTLSGQI